MLGLIFLLSLAYAPSLHAQTISLTASIGMGGRYRSNGWVPVVVTVTNTGSSSVQGQLEVAPGDDTERRGGYGAAGVPQGAVYARPITISPGGTPQAFSVYIRNWDPSLDDLKVRLRTGNSRGNVLAQAPPLTSSAAGHALSVPVTDTDLLLVGFADDPAAFTFLSGQNWGLQHAPDGPHLLHRTSSRSYSRTRSAPIAIAPLVQVASAGPNDLPDKSAAYNEADAVFLRADAPLEALTEAQTQALKDWVIGGGTLIVCSSDDPSRLSSAFYTDLLPARVDGTHSVIVPAGGSASALVLTPKPLPGVQVITKSADGTPLIVSGAYGAGRVILTAFDPTSTAFRTWTGPQETAFWRKIVTDDGQGTSSLLAYVGAQEVNTGYGYGYGYNRDSLASTVIRAPSLDAPAASIIGFFLLGYLIVLVPINYLVLKRLDKKEWAWVTVPVLVMLFAGATYGVGYAAKGNSLFVNRGAIVETSAGQSQAGVYAGVGLFSPHRTVYDLSLPQSDALSASPTVRSYSYGSGTGLTSPEPRFVQSARETVLQDVAVNMWAMRAFDMQTTTDLGGSIEAPLTVDAAHSDLRGTIVNHTAHDLSDCALYYAGQWQTLGDLKRGASKPVIMTGLPFVPSVRSAYYPTSSDFDIPTGGGSRDSGSYRGTYYAGASDSRVKDARQRMQPALADFTRALSHNDSGYSGPSGEEGQLSYSPARTEAIMIGWNMDETLAGPSPRVDGHAVKQNDVNLVIVHVSLKQTP